MFPLQIAKRKWRKWKFVDGFHRLPDSSSLICVHGSTLSDRYYCEFLWSWEKFLWRWSTVQPKMRYATVVVKVHAGKTTKWAHALMIGKESLKGWWILTTLKKWTGWAQALFWKVVGDRFYSSSVPIPSTLRQDFFEKSTLLLFWWSLRLWRLSDELSQRSPAKVWKKFWRTNPDAVLLRVRLTSVRKLRKAATS